MAQETERSHVNNYIEVIRSIMGSVRKLLDEFMRISSTEENCSESKSDNGFMGYNLYFTNDYYRKMEIRRMLFFLWPVLREITGKIRIDFFTDEELFDFIGYGDGFIVGMRGLIFNLKQASYPEEYNEYFLKPIEDLLKHSLSVMKKRNLSEEALQNYWKAKFGWDKK